MRLTSDAGVVAARLPTTSAQGISSIRIAGWGATGAGISTTLRTTTLSVIDFTDSALFASTFGTAVCAGDSGGPNLDPDGTLIAVNSLSSSGVCNDPSAISGHAPLFVQVPWITTVTGITPPSLDQTGPVATNVVAEPLAVNATGTLHARMDDLATGNSAIAAAFLQVDAGSPIPMTALDGAFDEPVEDVVASFVAPFVAPSSPGLHTACVDGSYEHGNVGQPACTLVAIYDPAGGFATGAGWIDSGDPLTGPRLLRLRLPLPARRHPARWQHSVPLPGWLDRLPQHELRLARREGQRRGPVQGKRHDRGCDRRLPLHALGT